MNDVIKISRGTTKQDELFEYADIPDYMKPPENLITKIEIKEMILDYGFKLKVRYIYLAYFAFLFSVEFFSLENHQKYYIGLIV